VIAISLLAMLAVAHALWSHHAEGQLRSRIDSLHAAGELVTADDFRALEHSGPGNAASDITAAATILDDDTVYSRSVDAVSSTQPVVSEAWPYLEASVKWFEPALLRIDRADQKPFCWWSHRYRSPVFQNLSVPELNQCRALTLLLIASSQVEHHRGNDALVAQRLRQMLYLAHAADGSPTMIGHLVSISVVACAASHIEAVAPDLDIGEKSAGDVNPEVVRELIDALLDETETADGLRKAIQAERMQSSDELDSFWQNSTDVGSALMSYVDQPWRFRAELACIDQCSKAAAIMAASPDWPTASASLQALPEVQGLYAFADGRTSLRRMALAHYQRLTDRRLAATALAVRLFVVDHAGRFPSKLHDLVPTYLSAVPRDSMAAGGQPIRYLARTNHPVLYSVGTDGVDDGGSEAAMPNTFGDLDEWERLDRVFYLTLQLRAELYVARPMVNGLYPVSDAAYDTRAPWERHDPITPDWHPSTQP
jgi:hypothetical protein